MKKSLQLCLLIIGMAFSAKAQENRITVDYQYIRTPSEYHAYTVFVKSNNAKSEIDLELFTTLNNAQLQSIAIKKGNKFIQIPFIKLDTLIKTDDENVKSIVVTGNLKAILNNNVACETTIVFNFNDGIKVELPFMFCVVRDKLKSSNL